MMSFRSFFCVSLVLFACTWSIVSLVTSAVLQPEDLVLDIVRKSVEQSLLSGKQDDLCKWSDINKAYLTFLDTDKLLGGAVIVNDVKQYPLMVQTPCFSHGSLGNDLSQYIEARICAHVAGIHYISGTHMDPSGNPDKQREDKFFFDAFPKTVRHPNPTNRSVAEVNIKSVCPCPSMCHEWDYGLMHSHMDIARKIFRTAIDNYWSNRRGNLVVKDQKGNPDLLDLRNMKSPPFIGKNQITYSLLGNDSNVIVANTHANESVVQQVAISNSKEHPLVTVSMHDSKEHSLEHSKEHSIQYSLPVIPDVAIHYRCGDNVVTHYGFTPFRVFANQIPSNSKYIYIMAESPERNSKSHTISRCSAIFHSLSSYLMEKFPMAFVVILRGHDMLDDLARLTYANVTICSVSTFCLWPAISNNNSAYYPVTKLIAKENISFNYGKSFHWLSDEKDKAIRGVIAVHMTNHALVTKLLEE